MDAGKVIKTPVVTGHRTHTTDLAANDWAFLLRTDARAIADGGPPGAACAAKGYAAVIQPIRGAMA